MRSLCYTGPNQLELREALKPEPKEGEVLLRVRACGICGSDVHGFLGLTGRRLPPMTMGHEFSAEVAQLGPATGKFKVGTVWWSSPSISADTVSTAGTV